MLIQHIYQDMDFKSPFLLIYLANSLLVLYLPLWQLWIFCGLVKPQPYGSISSINPGSSFSDPELIVNELHEDAFSDAESVLEDDGLQTDLAPVVPKPPAPITHWDIIRIAAIICPLWFLSNCLYNYSLFMTSVSSSTIIRYVYAYVHLYF